MSISDDCAGVTPASLSFLAIYNPSLSKSEETFHDQIVYYYSRASNVRSNGKHGGENGKEDRNERERQIGLARGMVEFAKWLLPIRTHEQAAYQYLEQGLFE